jgi:hypothetical protein
MSSLHLSRPITIREDGNNGEVITTLVGSDSSVTHVIQLRTCAHYDLLLGSGEEFDPEVPQ